MGLLPQLGALMFPGVENYLLVFPLCFCPKLAPGRHSEPDLVLVTRAVRVHELSSGLRVSCSVAPPQTIGRDRRYRRHAIGSHSAISASLAL